MTILTDRQQQALEITGVAPTRTVKMELSFLRTQGILIDLDITGTGMFSKAPNWVELGIQEFNSDPRTKQFTKGTKCLTVPEKVAKIKSFESRLRQNLDKHTYDVTGFKPFRWLPYTAYQAWRTKHDSIVAEANTYIMEQMVDKHDENVDYVVSEFTQIADAAWLSATTGETSKGRRTQKYSHIILWDKTQAKNLTLDHDAFVDYIVSQALSQVPTPDQILNKLRFDYTTALVYGEEDVASDEAAAANIRAQVAFDRERSNLENELMREQVRKQAWDNQAEQMEREAKLEAMRQAEYAHHRQQLQETISPFAEVYRQAISQFIDHAKDILESVQKNKHIRGKVAERGRGLLDIYNLMVIPGMGDDRMMQYLKDLRGLIGEENTDARSSEAITAKLQEIIDLEAAVASDMQTAPSTFKYLDIGD